jgi:hypothetical protein
MIAAPVQCDVDGIPKGPHGIRVLAWRGVASDEVVPESESGTDEGFFSTLFMGMPGAQSSQLVRRLRETISCPDNAP